MQLFDPSNFGLQDHLRYSRAIIQNDGPDPSHFSQHRDWYTHLNQQIESGQVSETDRCLIRKTFGEAYSTKTLQGYVFHRPLGYPGDFLLIDKIYRREISADPRFAKYDQFFQSQQAAIAVRNRKTYFKDLVLQIAERHEGPIRVLNLACGPCRGLQELLHEWPSLPASFVCVDFDKAAIGYAKQLNPTSANGNISFEYANVLRMQPTEPFDLIWSAGLFDYFNDRVFVRALSRFLPFLTMDGEMVVGNFGNNNPSKGSMEALANWYLHHRTDEKLTELARKAGVAVDSHRIKIGFEPTGVNRFLHVRRTDSKLRWDLPHPRTRGPKMQTALDESKRAERKDGV